jgi:hypothetical protein
MYLNRFYLSLVFSFFLLPASCQNIIAEENDIAKTARELSLNLGKSEQRKVEKVNSLMVDAEKMLEQALKMTDKDKAGSQLRLSSDKCANASELLKDLYDAVVEDFYKKSNRIFINKFDHARYYDQKADGYMATAKRALQKRDSVSDLNEYRQLSANAFDAYLMAMIDQLRAMKIYQDFPIEYPYDWDDFFKQHQIILAREEADKSAKNNVYKVEKEQVVKESFKMIYFRVQIAAHTVQISESQLKPIYSGRLPVQEMKDGEWYKYTIGNFERYDQALELLKTCMVRKAFIVAYDSQNIKQDLKSFLKDPKK